MILDDVHHLTTEASQALLLFLLNHLPSRLHVLIGTRVDLPRLARWRARNQISELRSQELGFVSAEVEAFAHAMGLPLGSEAIRLLEERTEGWIAGNPIGDAGPAWARRCRARAPDDGGDPSLSPGLRA